MCALWYYKSGGKEFGPISSPELHDRAQDGRIAPDTPVRIDPDGTWVPAENVVGLFDLLGEIPSPSPRGQEAEEEKPTLLQPAASAESPAILAKAGSHRDSLSQQWLQSATSLLTPEALPTANPQNDSMPHDVASPAVPSSKDGETGFRRLLSKRGTVVRASLVLVAAAIGTAVILWTSRRGGDVSREPPASANAVSLARTPASPPASTTKASSSDATPSSDASSAGSDVAESATPAAATVLARSSDRGKSAAAGSPVESGRDSPTPKAPAPPPKLIAQPPDAAASETSAGLSPPAVAPSVMTAPPAPAAKAAEPKALASVGGRGEHAIAPGEVPDGADAMSSGSTSTTGRKGAKKPASNRAPGSIAEDRRLARLRQIYEQTRGNADQHKAASEAFREFDGQMQEAQSQHAQMMAQLKAARQQELTIRQNIRSVKFQSAQSSGNIGDLQAALNKRLVLCLQMQASLAQQITAMEGEIGALEPKLNSARQRVEELSAVLSTEVIEEWFWLCDPFGKLDPSMHYQAGRTYSQWIAENPGFALFFLARGFAYLHVKSHELAEKDFNEAEHINSRLVAVTAAARGLVLARRGDVRESAIEFSKARKLKAKPGIVELFLAHAFLEQGKLKDAEKNFKLAAKLDNAAPQTHEALAFFLATRRASDPSSAKLAVQQATIAVKLTQSDDWTCLDTLAIACAAAGDFPTAMGWAKKAFLSAPLPCRGAIEQRLRLFEAEKPYRPE